MYDENDVLGRCVNAYEVITLAAKESGAPLRKLDVSARTLILDLLALRIATQKNILGEELAERLKWLSSLPLVRWADLADVFALFAERRSGATFEKETGLTGLWPLNEFVSENALSQVWILLSEIKGELPVRILSDTYQTLIEVPIPTKFIEQEKRKLRIKRRDNGVFFTPQIIVDKIIKLVIPKPARGKKAPYICDPAMGTGHFLISTAWYLSNGDIRSARHIAETRLYGVDSNPEIVRLARVTLWLEFSSPLLPFTVPDHFLSGDSLVGSVWHNSEEELAARKKYEPECFDWGKVFPKIKERGGFDIVLGNPPYDVLTSFKSNPEKKLYVKYLRDSKIYKNALSGQLNLYRLFIERSFELLKNGGNLSFIVPSSFMTDKMASTLRKHLLQNHSLSRIEHFTESEKVFSGVGQASIIFLASKNQGQTTSIEITSTVESSGMIERKRNNVKFDEIKKLDSELQPIPIIYDEEWEILKWLRTHCKAKFSDIADGYAGEVDQTVYSDCIRDDKGTIFLRGCHISPFYANENAEPSKARFIDADAFREKRGDGVRAVDPFSYSARTVQLGIRNMESLPRLVAAEVKSKIYLGNSVNYWLARGGVPYYLITALLNSSLYDWRFRLTSSNNNINIYEILSLPFPTKLLDYFRLGKNNEIGNKARFPMLLKELEQKTEAAAKAASLGGDITKFRIVIDETIFQLFGLPNSMRKFIMKKSPVFSFKE